ncbi:MAG TPA: NapC/NirT family cytochrome c [Candidatus Angelobacter sp.]
MKDSNTNPVWFVLTRHWLSLAGVALVTSAGISWLFVWPLHTRSHAGNPYAGIVLFLLLPMVFFTGLALIPIGVFLSKRRIREGIAGETFDRKAALRRLGWFIAITTLANVIIGTQFTYGAIKHMETQQFCGATCHTMKPELSAYENSPHSRLECVECHVAPGAGGWIKSKASGIRQLVEMTLNTYPRPIPPALESNSLVPSSETCENCHWPQKSSGVSLRVLNAYAEDETNTRSETVLLMLVGGNKFSGIHGAHLGPGIHIRFAAADPARQTIPWVEVRNRTTGAVRTYSVDAAEDAAKGLPTYEMQCVDCHNRPTHTFDLPGHAVDQVLARGDVSSTLPYIKKKAVELLQANYRTSQEAATLLPDQLVKFYQQHYPAIYAQRPQDVQNAAKAILAIYNRNVFPEMKVVWGTYPNNLGHSDFPGCFRCHDGSHTTQDGKTISQDCNLCHQSLPTEAAPPEILKTLRIEQRIAQKM